jgi:hypothetical protein
VATPVTWFYITGSSEEDMDGSSMVFFKGRLLSCDFSGGTGGGGGG